MAGLWISLPASWKLQDVQAALNVIITILSTLGVFVFVRFCWQRAARRVAHNQDVPLPSLLSLNTLGEALDVLFLLKEKLLSPRYLTIFAQCIVVICLSSTAILAGVIARYSTRIGELVSQQDVPGFLATRSHNGMGFANVEWNLTYTRLESADFPRDQLFDYLPINSIPWVYRAAEWNSSWSLSCQETPKTAVELENFGNCSGMRDEIPGLSQTFNYSKYYQANDDYWGYTHDSAGFYNSRDNIKDELVFIHGWKGSNWEEACGTYRSVSMSLTAVHMHNVPRNQNDTNDCNYAPGKIGESSYTSIDCELERREKVPSACDVAFPETDTNEMLALACTEYYQARFAQESTSDSPITTITPPELIRFYQVYTIIKDLQYRQPVTRRLSVSVRVVQLSTVFLTVALFIALLIILGLLQYGVFALRHYTIMETTPQSKLDWMMQSIQTEDRPLVHGGTGGLRRSVTVEDTSGLGLHSMPSVRRKRTEFEGAKYGGRATTTWFLRDSTATTEYGVSPRVDNGEEIGNTYHGTPQMVQQSDKTPVLNVNLNSGSYHNRPL